MYQKKSFSSVRTTKSGNSFNKNRGKFKSASQKSSSNNDRKRSGGLQRSEGSYVPYGSAPRKAASFGGGSRSRSSFGGRGPKRFRGVKKSILDPNKFIKKAVPVAEVEEYIPKHKFSDFRLVPELKSNIIAKGYETPTPIQDQSIPEALNGRDIIGVAATGTGKTAAFIVPLINKVFMGQNQKVLIITPTRELASQIDIELREFSKGMRIRSVQCIGGARIGRQISELSRNPQFVIGTPGRINDLIKRGRLRLETTQNIVLDEVDRMVDMGFINDIKTILSKLPRQKQSLFFSATIPPRINDLIKTFLNNPVTVSVKTTITSDNVEQDVVKVRYDQKKIEVLHDILNKPECEKVIIFGRTKRGVELLSKDLVARGFKSSSIHGDKAQNKREKALQLFKADHVNILVATDVAARGLDIDDVTHVINYDLPENYEDYIHRIGRTGRANKRGTALTFVS